MEYSSIIEDIDTETELHINMELIKKKQEYTQVDNDIKKYIEYKFNELDQNNLKRNTQMTRLTLKKKESKRCFTCSPRGKIKKHIIGKSVCSNFLFHHDMNHRPLILVTPVKHMINIEDFDPVELCAMFNAIKQFCIFWSISDYKVSYNCGSWKAHEHFHIKIYIHDKIANRMRGDHFRKIKYEENYEKTNYNKTV